MIPCSSLVPKPVTTLPVANGKVFQCECCKCILQLTIIFGFFLVLVRGSGQMHQVARLSVTYLLFSHKVVSSFPLGLRR